MIEKFQPDIIILEDAERGARVKEVVNTAKGIMSKKKGSLSNSVGGTKN